MKKQLFIAMLFLMTLVSQAQSNYKKGYIITNEKDTIYGLIDFRTDRINQESCKFKLSPDDKETIYSPNDIMGYRFTNEGKYYVAHDIEIEGIAKRVFLEFMVQGVMNLYSYHGKQQYFFFEDADGKMSMITKNPDKIEDTRLIKDTKYKGALIYLFKDYDSMKSSAERAEFNQKSMIDIAKKYHNEVCTTGEECIVFENTNPDDSGIRVKLSAYLGLQLFTYKIADYFENLHNSTSIAPAIGGQINLYNPRWSKSFSLLADISFSRFEKKHFKILAPPEEFGTGRANRIYDYKGFSFSGKVGFKYTYPKHQFRPSIEAGFSSLFMFGESGTLTYEYQNTTTNTVSNEYKLRSNYYGYYVAAGLDYNLQKDNFLFIRLSYEGYIQNDKLQSNFKDNLSVPQIKLGYTF